MTTPFRANQANTEATELIEAELLRRHTGSLTPAAFEDYAPAHEVRAWATEQGIPIPSPSRRAAFTRLRLAYIDAHTPPPPPRGPRRRRRKDPRT